MSVLYKTNKLAYKYLSILILSIQFVLATLVFWSFQQEPANAAVGITCPTSNSSTIYSEVKTNLGLGSSAVTFGSETEIQVSVALVDTNDIPIETAGRLSLTYIIGLDFTESGGTLDTNTQTYSYGVNHVQNFYGSPTNVNRALDTLAYISDSNDSSVKLLCKAFPRNDSYEYYSSNEHFYRWIDRGYDNDGASNGIDTFEEMAKEACNHRYLGMQGYLVTIESLQENTFITEIAGDTTAGTAPVGAMDKNFSYTCNDGDSATTEQNISITATEDTWKWIDGPSAGCHFWSGRANGSAQDCDGDSVNQYVNWNSGEPNNAGNEDYGQFLIDPDDSSNGKWNDIPNAGSSDNTSRYYWDGYIIEYGGRSGETSGIASDSMDITVTSQSTITITCPATQSVFPQTATDLLGSSAVTGGTSSTIVLVTVGLSDNSGSTDGLSNLVDSTGVLTMSTTTGLTFTQSGGSYNTSSDSYAYGSYHVHTFYGTKSNVNAALDSLSYTSDETDNIAYLDCRASQKFDDIEYFAETNHFYQRFDSVSYLRWDHTLRDACTTRYRGLQGYLMDYTSLAEREWVEEIFEAAGGVWMGGSDDDITHTHTCSDDQSGTTEDNISVTVAAEGDWTWIDGPNKGTQFWDGNSGGSAQNNMYNAWGQYQPSNSNANGQQWLTAILDAGYGGKWNDAEIETSSDYESSATQEKFHVDSYIVEFGGRSSTYDTTTNTLSSDETIISVAPPAVTITCPSTLFVDQEVATSVGLSNAVSSANIGSFDVQVTVALTNGSNGDGLDTVISTTGDLTMSTYSGLTFTESGGSYISASDTYNYGANHVHTFFGSLANVNAALNTLSYDSDSDDSAADLDCRAFARVSGYEYFGGTNHFYKSIAMNTNTDWEDAILPLCDLRYKGLQGYALSIESQAENDWIKDTFGNQGTIFLGGTDSNETFTYDCDDNDSSTTEDDISVTIAAEGDWTWIDGPNKGVQFWEGGKTGSVQNGLFENWGVVSASTRQPDNASGGEDFLQMWLDDIPTGWSQGDWNDMERNPFGNTNTWEVVDSVIVEFGGRASTYDASDPISSDHTDITVYTPAQITCPTNTDIKGFKTFTSIDDDSSNNAITYEVFFSVAKGTLTLADASNATFSTGDGIDDTTMQFTITRTNFDAAVTTLLYKPTLDSNYTDASTDTLTCKIRNSGQSDWSDTDTATLTRRLNRNDAGNSLCTNINDKETFSQTSVLLGEYFTFEEDSDDITVLRAPNGQLTMRNTGVTSFEHGDGTGDAYSSSYSQGNLSGLNTSFNSGASGADFYVSFLVYTPNSSFPTGSSDIEYLEIFSFENTSSNDPTGYCLLKINVYTNPTVTWDDSDNSIEIAENAAASSLGGATITYAGSNNLDVSVSSDNGTLSLSSCTLTDSDTTTGRVVLNGSLSALNTCLENLQFAPTTDFEGTVNLSISATPDTDYQYFSQTDHYYLQYQGSESPYRDNMTRLFTNMKFASLSGYVLTLECQSEEDFILNTDNFSFPLGGTDRKVDAFLAVDYDATDSEWQYSDGPQSGNLVGYDDCSDSSWTEPTNTSDSKYTTIWATNEPTASAGTYAFINGYTGDSSVAYSCAVEYEPTSIGWGDALNGAGNCNVTRASDDQSDSATYNQGMIGEFGGDGGSLPSSLTDSLSVVVSSSLTMSTNNFGNLTLTRGVNNDVTTSISISGTGSSVTLKIQSDLNGAGKMYVDTNDSNTFDAGELQMTAASRMRVQATSNCLTVYDDNGSDTPGIGNYPSDWLTLNGSLQTLAVCNGPITAESITVGYRVTPASNERHGVFEIAITFTIADS